jgi:Haem-binding domain
MIKKIFFILLAFFFIIQFIRPAKNQSSVLSSNDITLHVNVPDSVLHLLQRSCYDCHSNNTVYPWYDNIQPVGWWLQYHVNHGKRGLNFSEFFSYTPQQQAKKLKNISREIKEDGMPLESYLWIHKYAAFSPEEKDRVIAWADSLQVKIAGHAQVVGQGMGADQPAANVQK